MANDGKIYITISDKRYGRNEPDTPSPTSGGNKKDKENVLKDYIRHRFFNFVESQAKQAINYSISNIGNFTGDYIKQAQISSAMEIAEFGMNVAEAAIAGFTYTGNVYGGLIGAGIVIAGKTITTTQQTLASYAENTRQNRAIDQLRTRAGLNSTNNGSRGTEY